MLANLSSFEWVPTDIIETISKPFANLSAKSTLSLPSPPFGLYTSSSTSSDDPIDDWNASLSYLISDSFDRMAMASFT